MLESLHAELSAAAAGIEVGAPRVCAPPLSPHSPLSAQVALVKRAVTASIACCANALDFVHFHYDNTTTALVTVLIDATLSPSLGQDPLAIQHLLVDLGMRFQAPFSRKLCEDVFVKFIGGTPATFKVRGRRGWREREQWGCRWCERSERARRRCS
jgi:hypothetical protein